MELTSLANYARYLTNAVLETDDPMNKPMVRNRRPVVRTAGWLKGSDNALFVAIFVHEENHAFSVSARCNRNGCFHYPAIPKTEITSEKANELAEKIIADVQEHMDFKKVTVWTPSTK